jgi:hypothetical protein
MHILYSTYRTYTDTQTLIDTLITRYRAVLPASLDMTEDVRQKTLKYEKQKYLFFEKTKQTILKYFSSSYFYQ